MGQNTPFGLSDLSYRSSEHSPVTVLSIMLNNRCALQIVQALGLCNKCTQNTEIIEKVVGCFFLKGNNLMLPGNFLCIVFDLGLLLIGLLVKKKIA